MGLDVWMVRCLFREEEAKSLLSLGNRSTVHIEGTYDGESKTSSHIVERGLFRNNDGSLGFLDRDHVVGGIRHVTLKDCSVVSAKNPPVETMSASNLLEIAYYFGGGDAAKDKAESYKDRRIIVHGVITGIGRGEFSKQPYIEFKFDYRTVLSNNF